MLKLKQVTLDTVGEWVEYGATQDGIKFQIRPLTGNTIKELRKQCVTTKTIFVQGKPTKQETLNEEQFELAVRDYILQDWQGLGNEAGEVLVVNEANKALVFDNLELNDFLFTASKSLDMVEEKKIV